MITFLVIALIGVAIGYFWGRIYHNLYGLGHLLNALIGLAGALLGAFAAMWLTGSAFAMTTPFNWGSWLGAAAGAFLLVSLAGFARGRQYE